MTTQSLPAPRSVWRFFPHAMIGLLLTVVVVNFGMIWSATRTFPGAVDDHAFDTGNNYNAILDAAARQAALGWQLDVAAGNHAVAIRLDGKDGKPLTGVTLHIVAEHPVGPAERTEFAFAPADGSWVAPLPSLGQWQIELVARHDDQELRATRRLVLQ